jgi:hypothetical protein
MNWKEDMRMGKYPWWTLNVQARLVDAAAVEPGLPDNDKPYPATQIPSH